MIDKSIDEPDIFCQQKNVQNLAKNPFERVGKSSTLINVKEKFQTPQITHFVKRKLKNLKPSRLITAQFEKSQPLNNVAKTEITSPKFNNLVPTKTRNSFSTPSQVL